MEEEFSKHAFSWKSKHVKSRHDLPYMQWYLRHLNERIRICSKFQMKPLTLEAKRVENWLKKKKSIKINQFQYQ